MQHEIQSLRFLVGDFFFFNFFFFLDFSFVPIRTCSCPHCFAARSMVSWVNELHSINPTTSGLTELIHFAMWGHLPFAPPTKTLKETTDKDGLTLSKRCCCFSSLEPSFCCSNLASRATTSLVRRTTSFSFLVHLQALLVQLSLRVLSIKTGVEA